MSKKLKFGAEQAEPDQKFVCSDNPVQNIWNRVKKSNKIGQKCKGLIATFVYFLAAYCQFSRGKLGIRLCLHPNLRIF